MAVLQTSQKQDEHKIMGCSQQEEIEDIVFWWGQASLSCLQALKVASVPSDVQVQSVT